MDFMNVVDGK